MNVERLTRYIDMAWDESIVPALEQIIKRGGQLGVNEIVVGMPHRGRLNVLANVMAKPYRAIFNEFRGGSAHPDDVDFGIPGNDDAIRSGALLTRIIADAAIEGRSMRPEGAEEKPAPTRAEPTEVLPGVFVLASERSQFRDS